MWIVLKNHKQSEKTSGRLGEDIYATSRPDELNSVTQGWAHDVSREFTGKETGKAKRYMKTYSICNQIKTMRQYFTPPIKIGNNLEV